MVGEGREQVTRIGIVRVNGQPEELDGPDGRRQPSMGGTSRVSREAQARICERLGVKFPGATRPRGETPWGYSPGGGLREPSGGGAIPEGIPGTPGEVRPGIACGEDAADRVRAVRRPQPREAGRGNAGDLYVCGLHTLLWEAPEGWSVHRTARDGEESAGGQAPSNQDGAETPPARAGRVRGCMASDGQF